MRTCVLAVAVLAAVVGCGSSKATESPVPAPAGADAGAQIMVDCLRAKGWNAVPTADSPTGYELVYPADKQQQFEADRKMCRKDNGPDAPPPISEAQATQLYDRYLAVADCVRRLGFDVEPVPERPEFVRRLIGEDRYTLWHPYNLVAQSGNGDAMSTVVRDCPDGPSK